MKKTNKLFAAAALSAALICTLPVAGNAAAIDITDTSISLEAINKDWNEVSDPNTLHTFTNGTDVITVLKYYNYKDLPAPVKVNDKYKAVYQTFFSAGDEIYVVTGSAVKAESISEVKDIIDSISYPEVSSAKTAQADSADTTINSAAQVSSYKDETSDSSQLLDQGWNSIVLYDIQLNGVEVTRGNDGTGNWYDKNGVSYGNLDETDESAPIYNSNGEVYYWNGTFALEAASVENAASVNDPYDLCFLSSIFP